MEHDKNVQIVNVKKWESNNHDMIEIQKNFEHQK